MASPKLDEEEVDFAKFQRDEDDRKIGALVRAYFRSGNDIEVKRATILRGAIEEYL